MEDLKHIIASNITALRTASSMTQLELAQKLHYSDKSVSKWERAESVPDVIVLKEMADIFGVTVDEMLTDHDGNMPMPAEERAPRRPVRHRTVIAVVLSSIWTVAFLTFVILWLCGNLVWYVFACAVPVSLIVLLVLHSVWQGGRYNFWIVSALTVSILLLVYLTFLLLVGSNPWQICLLAIPAEIIVFLCFRIREKQKNNDISCE